MVQTLARYINLVITKLKSTHYPFFLSGFFTLLMGLFFVVGLFFDERYIGGAAAWLKPTKFALSVTVYTFTMLWFMSYIETTKRWRKRLLKLMGWVLVLTLAAEWVGIITQVIRGTSSHFNVSSPFNTAIWSLMAVAIMILFIANIVIASLLIFQRFTSPVLAWGLRLGLIITLIGLAEGYLMTSPTAQQLASWEAGGKVTLAGAHAVGVEDGGPGLPLLKWSTEGGDLRIGHFVGMHALQILPLFAWFISRRRLRLGQQLQLVWIAALAYLALVGLVTWQALRAQPLIRPDSLTLISFFTILAFVLLASLVTLMQKPRLSPSKPAADRSLSL